MQISRVCERPDEYDDFTYICHLYLRSDKGSWVGESLKMCPQQLPLQFEVFTDLVYALIKTKSRDRLNKMKQSIVVHPVCEWLSLMQVAEQNSV